MKLKAVGLSDVGLVRKNNQDSYIINEDLGLAVVADGMGGHAGGDIASNICVAEIENFLTKNRAQLSGEERDVLALLTRAVNAASAKIFNAAQEDGKLRGMGTTASLFILNANNGYFAHVGDSRVYLLSKGHLSLVTEDHTVINEKLKDGSLKKEEAASHRLRGVLTRCVGYRKSEKVDVGIIPVEVGDLVIICSDGLHGKMNEEELLSLIKEDREKAVKNLVSFANANGGEDNITVVLADIVPN